LEKDKDVARALKDEARGGEEEVNVNANKAAA
jgi:hypothetical protein